MNSKLIILGLLTLAELAAAGGGLAAVPIDPHQRAREAIVPPIAYAPAPRGVMGRMGEFNDMVDAHKRARNTIRDDLWPTSSAQHGGSSVDLSVGQTDPHRHVRSLILGHDD
ncbi:MAG: hypothetical protein HYZ18_16640 [Pseudogulbenkiania sp.]|nr:hypothetical protein [Pseudogulbenkiania sp.]